MSKRSTAAEFWPSTKSNFQLPHESDHRHPEIIPHHDDALHPAAVALPQGLHQFGVLFFLLGVQPLLELVEDDQHLLARRECPVPGAVRPASLSDPGCRAGPDSVSADRSAGGFLFPRRWLRRRRRSRRRTGEAATPPSPATICRTPMARRSGPPRRSCRRPFLRCESSRTECCRAIRLGHEGRAAVRGRSRRRGRQRTASLSARS